MALRIARFINLMLAGLLTGNEVGTWAVIHPALHTLPVSAHIQSEQELVRRFRAIMPIVMSAVIFSHLPVLALMRDRRSPAFRYTLAGAACYIGMLASTVLGNQPINSRTLEADPQAPPADWHALRARWDRLHTLRSILNMLGLGLLVAGVLSEPNK